MTETKTPYHQLKQIDVAALKSEDEDLAKGKIQFIEALALIEQQEVQKAIDTLLTSFYLHPSLDDRNIRLISYLIKHEAFERLVPVIQRQFQRDISDIDDRNETLRELFVELVQPLIAQNKVVDYPQFLAFYHHILFCQTPTDKTHSEAVHALTQKYPNNSELWKLSGLILLENKNLKLAANAFINYFEGDYPIIDSYIEEMLTSFLAADKKIKDIPIGQFGFAVDLYNAGSHVDDVMDIHEDNISKKTRKQLARLKVRFYGQSYEQFAAYHIDHQGILRNGDTHCFAMCCNNYAIALTEELSTKPDKKEKKIYLKSCRIHWQGYQISPFYENLMCGSHDARYARDWDQVITYCKTFFKDFEGEEEYYGSEQYHDFYNMIVNAYWQKDDYENMFLYYQKAAKLFAATQNPENEETDDFLETASYCSDQLDIAEKTDEKKQFIKDLKQVADWEALEEYIEDNDKEDEFCERATDMLDELTGLGNLWSSLFLIAASFGGLVVITGLSLVYGLKSVWDSFL